MSPRAQYLCVIRSLCNVQACYGAYHEMRRAGPSSQAGKVQDQVTILLVGRVVGDLGASISASCHHAVNAGLAWAPVYQIAAPKLRCCPLGG